MSVYRRGRKYWYKFHFAGQVIRESSKTASKTVAKEAERARRRELEERFNGVKKRSLPPTFERAAKEWIESRGHRVASNTQSVARLALKHLLPSFGAKLLCDIDRKNIEAYQKDRLDSGAESRTINIEVSTLRQVLKANDMWQPFAGKVHMLRERHDVAQALTPEQECALVRATAESDSACHTATVLALNTAMRKNEIRLLRWEQVDLAKRTLTVGRSKNGSGRWASYYTQSPGIRITGRLGQPLPELPA